MVRVFVPPQLRDVTQGAALIEAAGGTVGALIADLERRFPGFAQRVLHDGSLAPGLAVSIDSAITARSLHTLIGSASEVHFVPAIAGG